MLEEARLSALIHKTACNFKKVPGKKYYVYKQRKNPEDEMISMISPEEWGPGGPEYVAGQPTLGLHDEHVLHVLHVLHGTWPIFQDTVLSST